jgi:hypothetical protein
MSSLWCGVIVSGSDVTCLAATYTGEEITTHSDTSFTLASGSRPEAYATMFHRMASFLKEAKVTKVVVKGSAAMRGATIKHLESAELRGVIIAAAAEARARVFVQNPAGFSKMKIGGTLIKDLKTDDSYWNRCGASDIKKILSREAALLILIQREE